jgi:hypothetical protein
MDGDTSLPATSRSKHTRPARSARLHAQGSRFPGHTRILFVLWLLARRKDTKDFSAEAQQVLEEKFKKGEIDKKTYDKYRQELSMRIKKE